jgi:hypothetical protein
MGLVLYTVADEAYVPGVAALINSARRNGVKGEIHIGSPKPLRIADCQSGLIFHDMGPSDYWPVNRKAELLLRHGHDRVIFCDADMVIADPTFLPRVETWLQHAPVFTIESQIPAVDYRRHQWARRLNKPIQPRGWPSYYFNAGLFALDMGRDRAFLKEWDELIRRTLKPPGAPLQDVDFPTSDQDVLNGILQDGHDPIPIAVCPSDIWSPAAACSPFLQFGTFSGSAMLHGTGSEKPWQLKKMPRRGPNPYDLAWYNEIVIDPICINLKTRLSPMLHDWFRRGRLSRTIGYIQRRLY